LRSFGAVYRLRVLYGLGPNRDMATLSKNRTGDLFLRLDFPRYRHFFELNPPDIARLT